MWDSRIAFRTGMGFLAIWAVDGLGGTNPAADMALDHEPNVRWNTGADGARPRLQSLFAGKRPCVAVKFLINDMRNR